MRFRSIAQRILIYLLKAKDKGGKEFLDAIIESVVELNKSIIGSLRDKLAIA